LQKILRFVLLALVVLSPFLLLTTLPFHDLGLFKQSEPPAVAIHAVAGLAALAMLLLYAAPASGRITPVLTWPTIVLIGLSAAGFVSSIFSAETFLGITGSLEHGVGALWFLETAILAMAASTVVGFGTRFETSIRWAVAVAIVAGIGLQAMRLASHGALWVPYDFPEWIGMIGPVAAAVVVAGGSSVAWSVGGAILAASLVFSDNRATALIVIVWLVLLAFSRLRSQSVVRTGMLSGGFALIAVVGLVGLFAIRAPLEHLAASSADVVGTSSIASTNPLDHVALQEKAYGTLWQRGVNIAVTVRNIVDHPSYLLTGRGYGSFEQVVSEEGHFAAGRYFERPSPAASLTYWDGDRKARFHTHNLLMESILASGLVGGLLWLAFLFSTGAAVRNGSKPAFLLLASTLAVGGTFWFFVNTMSPFLAVAIAMVASPIAMRGGPTNLGRAATTILLVFATFACLAWAAFTYATIVGEKGERRYLQALVMLGSDKCIGFSSVGMPNAQINTKLYEILVAQIESKKAGADRSEAMKSWWGNVSDYSCLMRSYSEAGNMASLRKSVEMRSKLVDLVEQDPTMFQALQRDLEYWPYDVIQLLRTGSGHQDLVLPLIRFVEAKASPEQTAKVIELLMNVLPDESPAKYLLSSRRKSLVGDAAGAEVALKEAMAHGLANLDQIDPSLR
jgi:hypothetical protein